ncbi:L,D-transpeptidase [Sinorhizobium sp. BG8]|uniref:L,D-transpeptidase n=1 Tax=Sinorhizobium sp. BG8 TaxID=2613773 RepID=UPI00193C8DAA|nr:L,D-transpeptidase [Sinorhizobium sp. BG8]QRM56555.1 L,D-transpeptidase [Sinorhizobium sp. BG8]
MNEEVDEPGVRRRTVLAGGLSLTFALVAWEVGSTEVVKEISDLKPGEFTWHPDRQMTGPLAVVVSLPEQLVHVYRNGIRIAVSTCSSGKPGHETPTGVFVILQKDKNHHSSTYDDASMPNMNRLTWSGVALHAGNLPGYPASHGCVRLPLDFSAKLFEITHLGTPVIIAGAATDPWELQHPGMVLAGYTESEFNDVVSSLDGKKPPQDWAEAEKQPVASAIGSFADRQIVLLENGAEIAEGTMSFTGKTPTGSHVFVLRGPHDDQKGMSWFVVSYSHDADDDISKEEGLLQQVQADPEFLAALQKHMHPGMMLVLTDVPLHPDTRSGQDFVIMS